VQATFGDCHRRQDPGLSAGDVLEGYVDHHRADTRNLHSALNPAIKSLNYLNNILAKIEANNSGCEEAIMLNAEGFVSECTADNVFIVKEGQLFTPPLSAGALYGSRAGS